MAASYIITLLHIIPTHIILRHILNHFGIVCVELSGKISEANIHARIVGGP